MKKFKSDELFVPNATIHVFESADFTGGAQHDHDFIEIVYIKSGQAEEYVNDDKYEVTRGDLIFINCGSTHRFVANKEFSYVNICFKPDVLDNGIITPEHAFDVLQLTAFDEIRREGDGGRISFESTEREEIETLLASMLTEYERKERDWQAVLKSYMNVLFVRMLRKTACTGVETDEPQVWRDLSAYIDEHLGGNLTLTALAGKCFYNPSYFSRAFKERFGMPLTEYVTRRKLDHAIKLTREGSLSVTRIAEQVGFSSTGALYRACLRFKGIRFSDLRKSESH
ncbi:MAG: helix-turn-helix domain-containing protein [Clostridia bacterium]|nr:helix-turn-helix domain-containing protein [Clostridia bacterium]